MTLLAPQKPLPPGCELVLEVFSILKLEKRLGDGVLAPPWQRLSVLLKGADAIRTLR